MIWVCGMAFVVDSGCLSVDVAGIHSECVSIVWRYDGFHAFGDKLCKHAIESIEDSIVKCSNGGRLKLIDWGRDGATLLAATRSGYYMTVNS